MALRDHTQATVRSSCYIVTSDPSTKTVQGIMRGGQVQISVFTTDPFFRWPKTGENWIVRQENGSWHLDSILQDPADPTLATSLDPGDVLVNAPGRIRITNGEKLVSSYLNTPEDFGAKGNDFDDDSIPMQEWLNANRGKHALLPADRTYKTTRELIVPSFTTIVGQNPYSSVIKTYGNHYAIGLGEPEKDAAAIEISGLKIEASEEQTEGGGIGWLATSAEVRLHDITFGNYLNIGLDISGHSIGAVFLDRLRWLGPTSSVLKSGKGIRIGDSLPGHLVVGVYANDIVCQAATTADMKTWLEINYSDTIHFSKCLFQTGTIGLNTQVPGGAFEAVTGLKLTEVVMDTMAANGFNLKQVRDCELNNCNAQGCFFGLQTLKEALGVRIKGGAFQLNTFHGMAITEGEHISVDNANITDNGSSGNPGVCGVSVAPGMSHWSVRNSRIGNLYNLGAYQKFGLVVEIGASDYYDVSHNEFRNNLTGGFIDAGTGTHKIIEPNLVSP
jgi:hypothetical protein